MHTLPRPREAEACVGFGGAVAFATDESSGIAGARAGVNGGISEVRVERDNADKSHQRLPAKDQNEEHQP